MVLAPHPDDESLGCGGMIAAACEAGTPPVVVFITDGAASHPGSRRFDATARRDIREQEARRAAAVLGLAEDRLVFLRLPDGAAPHEGPAFDPPCRGSSGSPIVTKYQRYWPPGTRSAR